MTRRIWLFATLSTFLVLCLFLLNSVFRKRAFEEIRLPAARSGDGGINLETCSVVLCPRPKEVSVLSKGRRISLEQFLSELKSSRQEQEVVLACNSQLSWLAVSTDTVNELARSGLKKMEIAVATPKGIGALQASIRLYSSYKDQPIVMLEETFPPQIEEKKEPLPPIDLAVKRIIERSEDVFNRLRDAGVGMKVGLCLTEAGELEYNVYGVRLKEQDFCAVARKVQPYLQQKNLLAILVDVHRFVDWANMVNALDVIRSTGIRQVELIPPSIPLED